MISNTYRQEISAVRNLPADGSGKPPLTSAWSKRMIKYFLDVYRNMAESEKFTTTGDMTMLSTLPCVALSKADQVECPCPARSGFVFLKPSVPLPDTIGPGINSVTSVMGNVQFSYVKWDDFSNRINSRIAAQAELPYYSLKRIDGKMYPYIYNRDDYSSVAITASFADPIQVLSYPKCGEEPKYICSPLDEEFLVSEELKPRIIQMVQSHLLGSWNTRTDAIPNEKDDTRDFPRSR